MPSVKKNLSQWSLVANDSWIKGQRFQLAKGAQTVGRSTDATLTFPSKHLSRLHAEITVSEDFLFVTDLKSANGTFVNGKLINSAKIKPGDHIRFDQFSFVVEGPQNHA